MRGFGNLGGLGNMGNLMKQVQKSMGEVHKMEEELSAMKVDGSAGGGMVRVECTAAGTLESVHLDPKIVDPDDLEMLQDLIVLAVRDAMDKAGKIKAERMKGLTDGLGLPPGMF